VIVFATSERPTRNPQPKIGHLPPSAKLVFAILKSNPRLNPERDHRGVISSPRTVRYALSRLKEEDVIVERFSFEDGRQSLYGLKATEVMTL
jgi:hypothetical protein